MEPWQILGIGPHATPDEIDIAYKARARQLHPDLDRAATPAEQTRRNAAMAELNAARDAMRGRMGSRFRSATPARPKRTGGPPPAGGGQGDATEPRPTGRPAGATGGRNSSAQQGDQAPAPAPAPGGEGHHSRPGDGATGDWARETEEPGDWYEPEAAEPAGWTPPGPSRRSRGSSFAADDPLWPPTTAEPDDAHRPGRAGRRGFVLVAGLGVVAAGMLVGAILVLVALANAFGGGSTEPDPVPAGPIEDVGLGSCIARGDSGFDGLVVDCGGPHLGRVIAVIPRDGACPDGSDFEFTRDGDPQRYCIDGEG